MNFEFGHLAELEYVTPDFSNNTERTDLSIDNSAILSVIQGPPRFFGIPFPKSRDNLDYLDIRIWNRIVNLDLAENYFWIGFVFDFSC